MQDTTNKKAQAMQARYVFDVELRQKHPLLCGVDEAGRGPLCGALVVAAVILNPENMVQNLNDSKKISEKKREVLFEEIQQKALAVSVVFVSPETIDRLNILWATMFGMKQAVENLQPKPDYVLFDGNRKPETEFEGSAVISGDFVSASIAAASILAKVTRDSEMRKLDKEFPQYKLAQHKGYPTKLHYELLREHGIQDFYRRSFLKKLGLK